MQGPPRIFESVLYAEDLAAAERFYCGVLGLDLISRLDLVIALRCDRGVLLIFDPNLSAPVGREVPSHGRAGASHLAFAATEAELVQWKTRLTAAGIPIEQEVAWEQGGRSIYFRDPAGNSLEFAPLTLWGGGWL